MGMSSHIVEGELWKRLGQNISSVALPLLASCLSFALQHIARVSGISGFMKGAGLVKKLRASASPESERGRYSLKQPAQASIASTYAWCAQEAIFAPHVLVPPVLDILPQLKVRETLSCMFDLLHADKHLPGEQQARLRLPEHPTHSTAQNFVTIKTDCLAIGYWAKLVSVHGRDQSRTAWDTLSAKHCRSFAFSVERFNKTAA